MRQQILIITLLAAIALTGVNAALVGLYVYASGAVAAEVDHPSAVSRLAAEGLLPEAQWNERLARDGRPYRLSVTSDVAAATGAVGISRDYLLPPRHHRLLTIAGLSVLLSLLTTALLALATWSAVRNRPAARTQS